MRLQIAFTNGLVAKQKTLRLERLFTGGLTVRQVVHVVENQRKKAGAIPPVDQLNLLVKV